MHYIPSLELEDRMAETAAQHRLKRLKFRSWHRGFREMDLILGPFADSRLAGFDPAMLDAYETLLGAPDWDLYAWISGTREVPENWDSPVLRAVIDFAKSGLK